MMSNVRALQVVREAGQMMVRPVWLRLERQIMTLKASEESLYLVFGFDGNSSIEVLGQIVNDMPVFTQQIPESWREEEVAV